jgi:hypothetical protein
MPRLSPSCVVCGEQDARALALVALDGGTSVVLCGSHALIHGRSGGRARSVAELRRLLAERRGRRDRREAGDELGEALTSAFQGEKRGVDRRSTG